MKTTMRLMQISILLIFLLAPGANAVSADYPEVPAGMCGPAKKIHKYLDEAGFFEEPGMAFVTPDGVYLTYLPSLDRVKSKKDEGGDYFLGVDVVHVLHTDRTTIHSENWRCITSVSLMANPSRESLTRYLNEIGEMTR